MDGVAMLRFGIKPRRFWRPLIGIVAAYAVAAQALLIALGGLNLTAQASEGQPAFELCLHDGQGAPTLPIGGPGSPGCSHCIFCFAGSHHALAGAPPVVFARIHVEIIDVPWIADKHALSRLPAYSIARPRGPPLRA
jgi:hypothetical protein